MFSLGLAKPCQLLRAFRLFSLESALKCSSLYSFSQIFRVGPPFCMCSQAFRKSSHSLSVGTCEVTATGGLRHAKRWWYLWATNSRRGLQVINLKQHMVRLPLGLCKALSRICCSLMSSKPNCCSPSLS